MWGEEGGFPPLVSQYHRAIPEKKQEGWGHTFLKKALEFLDFLLYSCKLQTKQAFTPTNSTKLCYILRKFQGLKPRPLEIPHDFFLITPENSALLLIKTQKIHLLFLQYPLKFHILNPLYLFFSGIAQSLEGGIPKIKKKKRGGAIVHGQVFLKEGRWALFLFNFFKVYHFHV